MRKFYFLSGVASSAFVFGHLIIGFLGVIAMAIMLAYPVINRIEKKLIENKASKD